MEKAKVIRHTFTGVVVLVGLVVFLGFIGAQWNDTFDGWGQGMRQALGRPISINKISTPMSPKGDWQIQIESRQWTWRNTDRTTQYHVQAIHNGQPYLAGANLDLAKNAQLFVKWPAEWPSDAAVSFIDDQATANCPVMTLAIKNETSNLIPYLLVYDNAQTHYLFDLPVGATRTLNYPLPAQGAPITMILGPQGKTLHMESPVGKPKSVLAKMKITLLDNQPEKTLLEMMR